MASHIAIAKEPPGALSAKGGDFVRIMTVHASKGLEFPIVGLAEMGAGKPRPSAFSCTSLDGKAYISLLPSRSVSGLASSSPAVKAMKAEYMPCNDGRFDDVVEAVDRAETPLAQREILREHEAEQELQERRRLLYVALTRAKEALVVAMTSVRSGKSDDGSSGINADTGIYDDIRSALFGLDDFEKGETFVDFGGSAPARVERIDVDESDFQETEQDERPAVNDRATCEWVEIPCLFERTKASHVRPAGLRKDVASYSSLAQAGGGDAPAISEPFYASPDEEF